MVYQFSITLRRPSGNDPGEALYVWYTVADDIVRLTDELGKPIDDRKKRYEQKLAEGEDHRAVARKLAWKHHTDRRGGPGDFNRPLSHRDYPDIGIV